MTFECAECAKILKTRDGIINHLKICGSFSTSEKECVECAKISKTRDGFIQHLKKCGSFSPPEKSIKCSHCNKLFSSASGLWYHKKHHHVAQNVVLHSNVSSRRQNLFKCLYCPDVPPGGEGRSYEEKQFRSNGYIQKRITVKNSRKYECAECAKILKTRRCFIKHLKRCGSSFASEKSIKCSDCNKLFSSASGLWYHKKHHHTAQNVVLHSNVNSSRRQLFKCLYCPAVFPTRKERSYQEEQFPSNGYLQKRNALKNLKEYECADCDKILKTRGGFIKHLKKCGSPVTSKKSIKCSYCYKLFSGASGLWYHKKHHHAAQNMVLHSNVNSRKRKLFKCLYCPAVLPRSEGRSYQEKQFSSNEYLKKRNALKNLREYECAVCAKILKTRRCFIKHLKRCGSPSKSEKSLKCSHCNKLFASASGLWYHKKHHHAAQNVVFHSDVNSRKRKLFKYSYCPAVLSSKKRRLCQTRQFPLNEYLQKRNGLKRCNKFECAQCSKIFKTRGGFIKHLKKCGSSSKSEKSLKCSHCNKLFSSISGLWYHKKHHHAAQNVVLRSNTNSQRRKLFKSLYCPAELPSREGRSYHAKQFSSNEYIQERNALKNFTKYECAECAKILKTRRGFIKHLKKCGSSPTSEKSKKCSRCNKLFSSASGLWYHKKHHHHASQNVVLHSNVNSRRRKLFKCLYCPAVLPRIKGQSRQEKQFPSNEYLKKRDALKSLNKYECTECGKILKTRYDFTKHLKKCRFSSTSEKSKKCSHCNKLFSSSSGLWYHKKHYHAAQNIILCNVSSRNEN